MKRANLAGLDSVCALIGTAEPGELVLYVGRQLAGLGVEGQAAVTISATSLVVLMNEITATLHRAGFDGDPQLHAVWLPDF